MKKAIRIILLVTGGLVLAGGLVFTGAWIGQRTLDSQAKAQATTLATTQAQTQPEAGTVVVIQPPVNGYEPGGMGGGRGMRNNDRNEQMHGYGFTTVNTTPLTIDQAYTAAEKFLTDLGNTDLNIAEVMVFDNNAYVRVVEKSTGIGAFELLVDPESQVVYAEPGPNMMWNLKYLSMHSGMMGDGFGTSGSLNSYANPATVSSEMPITAADALKAAQAALDTQQPGTTVASTADPFYGYYTIDILKDGKVIGMLSVNGFNSQVFIHVWHGTFISSQDY